jgi:hypothetical protein
LVIANVMRGVSGRVAQQSASHSAHDSAHRPGDSAKECARNEARARSGYRAQRPISIVRALYSLWWNVALASIDDRVILVTNCVAHCILR